MVYDIVSERKSKYCITVNQPKDAFEAVKRYSRKAQENFLVIALSGSHSVISVRIITVGLLNRTVVHPREVFRQAMLDNAATIIAAHNHPSGSLIPSPEDLEITQRLKEAGEIVGIELLDHLIISKSGFASLKELGHL